jgi:hypothetical protein
MVDIMPFINGSLNILEKLIFAKIIIARKYQKTFNGQKRKNVFMHITEKIS